MKRVAIYILTLLGIICFAGICRADPVKSLRIFGRISSPEVLMDGKKDGPFFGEMEQKGDDYPVFVCFLDRPRYISKILFYSLSSSSPDTVMVEVSDNLFQWETAATVKPKASGIKGIMVAEIPMENRAAAFIRFTAAGKRPGIIRITELEIHENSALKVQSVRLEVMDVQEYSVKLRMISDIATIGAIKFKPANEEYQDGPMVTAFAKENVVEVHGLLKGTDYNFMAMAKDCNNNTKYSPQISTRTKGIPLPLFHYRGVNRITDTEAELSFKCNVPVTCELGFGYDPTGLDMAGSSELKQVHAFTFSGLTPETELFYRIRAIDASGNSVRSVLQSLQTLPPVAGEKFSLKGDFVYSGESLGPRNDPEVITRLIDGQYSYKNGSAMSGNIISRDQFLELDLGESMFIERLDLVWWALMYSTEFKAEYSVDGRKWHVLGEKFASNPEIRYDFPLGTPYLVSRIKIKKELRYLRFQFFKGKFKARFPQYRNLRLLELLVIPQRDSGQPVQVEFAK